MRVIRFPPGTRVVSLDGSTGTVVEEVPFITGGMLDAGWDASLIPQWCLPIIWDRESKMGKKWIYFYDPPSSTYPEEYLAPAP